MGDVRFTRAEVLDLVYTIWTGIEAVDEGDLPRATWAMEMRDWCIYLVDRLHEEEDDGSTEGD